MLIFYLALLGLGMYWASKTLLPELLKPVPPQMSSSKGSAPSNSSDFSKPDESGHGTDKLGSLLDEKNKNIQLLQTELKILYAQVRDFDKLKTLLEGEIHRLKEQNRIFRSELGMPTVQPKEDSII